MISKDVKINVGFIASKGGQSTATLLNNALGDKAATLLKAFADCYMQNHFEDASLFLEQYNQVILLQHQLLNAIAAETEALHFHLNLLKNPKNQQETEKRRAEYEVVGRLNAMFEYMGKEPMPEDWVKDQDTAESPQQ